MRMASNSSVSSGDGSIDETEFSKVCSSHGVEEAEAREAFKKLGVVSINQAEKKDNDKKKRDVTATVSNLTKLFTLSAG